MGNLVTSAHSVQSFEVIPVHFRQEESHFLHSLVISSAKKPTIWQF